MHKPESYARMVEPIRKVMSGQSVHYEQRLTGPDGKAYCFDIRFIPRRSADGVISGYFVLAIDVTGNQEVEAALRSTTHRLELMAQMGTDVLGIHTAANWPNASPGR